MTMYGLGRQVGGYNGAEKYRVSQCSWTNGDTVRSINKEFLVTYQLDSDVLISSAQAENAVISDSPSRPAGPEPTLKIHLIALDSIQAINPCPEITKQELVSTFGIGRLVGQTPESFAARQSATVSNLKQVALGMIMYTNDYDDAYPYAQSTPAAFFVELPYVKNIQVFKSLNPKGSIIRFNMGISGGLASSIDSPAETVMFYESEAWDDGRRAVAYCDGHVKWVKAEDWATLSTKLKPASLQRVKQALPASYDLEWKKAVAQYAGRKNQG